MWKISFLSLLAALLTVGAVVLVRYLEQGTIAIAPAAPPAPGGAIALANAPEAVPVGRAELASDAVAGATDPSQDSGALVDLDGRRLVIDLSPLLGYERDDIPLVADIQTLQAPLARTGEWSAPLRVSQTRLIAGQRIDYWAVPAGGGALNARLVLDGDDDGRISAAELANPLTSESELFPQSSATWAAPAARIAGGGASVSKHHKLQLQSAGDLAAIVPVCYVHPDVLERIRRGMDLEQAVKELAAADRP